MNLSLNVKFVTITAEERTGYVLFAFAGRWLLED